jgi:hypothetical protein
MVLLAAGLSACDPSDRRSSSDDSVPADETAANGPLVGDPTLIADELTCVQNEDNAP